MTQTHGKLTINDCLEAPPGQQYQLMDGQLILTPLPARRERQVGEVLEASLGRFVTGRLLGSALLFPGEVILSRYDLARPDLVFVASEHLNQCGCGVIRGAPDLVVEILSPTTEQLDRGYKRQLYGRHGVREYWLVDPAAGTVEVLTPGKDGLTLCAVYDRNYMLASPWLPGLAIDLREIFES